MSMIPCKDAISRLQSLFPQLPLEKIEKIVNDLDQETDPATGCNIDTDRWVGVGRALRFAAANWYRTPFYKSLESVKRELLKLLYPATINTAETFLLRNELFMTNNIHHKLVTHFSCIASGALNHSWEPNEPEPTRAMVAAYNKLPSKEKRRALLYLHLFKSRHFLSLSGLRSEVEAGAGSFTSTKPNIEKVKQSVEQIIQQWKAKKLNADTARTQLYARILLLIQATTEEKKQFKDLLAKAYDPDLFDSDFDGVPDLHDDFPDHFLYSKDQNKNGIPDSIENKRRGPKDYYGLGDGDVLQIGFPNFIIERISPKEVKELADAYKLKTLFLFRIGDRVFISVNIDLITEHNLDLEKKSAYLRYYWRDKIEEGYRKILPKEVGPVTVLLNFYSPNGYPVFVRPDSYLSIGAIAEMHNWPIDCDIRSLLHETGHHLYLPDHYKSETEYCGLVAPGIPKIRNPKHLMGTGESTHLDPIDIIGTIDLIRSFHGTASSTPNLAVADAFLRLKQFKKAEAIYLDVYKKYSSQDFHVEFKKRKNILKRRWGYTALRGSIVAAIHIYKQNNNPELLKEIETRINKFAEWGKRSFATTTELNESLLDVQIFRLLLAQVRGDKEAVRKELEKAKAIDRINDGKLAILKYKEYALKP